MSFEILIAAIGKAKSTPEADIIARYQKRILWPMQIKEFVADQAPSAKLRKTKEALNLQQATSSNAYRIMLDEGGEQLTSRGIADIIKTNGLEPARPIAFYLGGADGIDGQLLATSHMRLGLGRCSMPHILARCVLVEQIYRAYSILHNHPYHRD